MCQVPSVSEPGTAAQIALEIPSLGLSFLSEQSLGLRNSSVHAAVSTSSLSWLENQRGGVLRKRLRDRYRSIAPGATARGAER